MIQSQKEVIVDELLYYHNHVQEKNQALTDAVPQREPIQRAIKNYKKYLFIATPWQCDILSTNDRNTVMSWHSKNSSIVNAYKKSFWHFIIQLYLAVILFNWSGINDLHLGNCNWDWTMSPVLWARLVSLKIWSTIMSVMRVSKLSGWLQWAQHLQGFWKLRFPKTQGPENN